MALNAQQQSALVSALQSKGYNATDAQNAASNAGGRADSLFNEYVGSSFGGGGGNSSVDGAMNELRKAIEVSTGALKGQQDLLPQQTAQKKTELQQQQSSLESRYANLLNEVKGQTEQAVNRTTGSTRQELANRGINLEGNLAQTEVNSAVNPLNMEAGRQITDLGISRESDIATITNAINKLPLEEQQMYLQLQQAIGAAQQSGSATELQYAMQLAKQAQDAAIAKQNYDLALKTQEQNAAKNAAEIKNIESQIANRNSTGGGSSSLNSADQAIISSYLNKQTTSSQVPSYFKEITTTANKSVTPTYTPWQNASVQSNDKYPGWSLIK